METVKSCDFCKQRPERVVMAHTLESHKARWVTYLDDPYSGKKWNWKYFWDEQTALQNYILRCQQVDKD